MDESTCTLHRPIPDRLDEVRTKYNVTCERISFTHKQQRRLLAQQLNGQLATAPSNVHDSNYISPHAPVLANGLETHGLTNGLLAQTLPEQGLWEPYTDWLQGDGLVYWVAGFKRSGKSTLMRFLRDDKTIQARTRLWASSSRLVKICFFLRQPTTYQEFLSEILHRAADGRPDMFHDLPMLPNLKAPELDQVFVDKCFRELVTGDHGKFLLMIDGVEHLEDGGNRLSLMLSRLLQQVDFPGASMKLCISTSYDSSLLWESFRPSVLMEHLTRFDLLRAIADELNENKEFSLFCKIHSRQAQDAIRLIVENAEGSFLYARLAASWFVARLVEIENISSWGQDSEAVKKLFSHIPNTAERIFKEMLVHEWPPGASALTLFGLFGQAEREKEPLSPLVLSFAEEPYDEDMEPGVRAATSSEIEQRVDRLRRYLFIRCGGLLEAPDAAGETQAHMRHHKAAGEPKQKTAGALDAVDGTLAPVRHHEVVGDWKDTMWSIIDQHSTTKSLHLQRDLCAAYLRRIKSLDTTQPTFFTLFRSLATACLKYSIKIEEPLRREKGSGENPNLKILLALNTDAKSLLAMPQPPSAKFPKTSHSDPPPWSVKVQSHQHAYLTIHPHWTNVCKIINYQPPSSFFDFALQHGLYSIVEHHLKQRPSRMNGNGNGHPVQKQDGNVTLERQSEEPERVHKLVSGRILPLTLIARTQHTTANLQPISIKMARILFKYGADPNYKQSSETPGTTAWHALLKAMAAEMPKEPKEPKKQNPEPLQPTTAGEQNTPTGDGKAKMLTPEQLKADRKKRDEDRARRVRLAQLAILFLNNGAYPYATVRKMAAESGAGGGSGSDGDKKKAATQGKQQPARVVRFVKGIGKRAGDNVVAAARGARGVPARMQRFRVRVRETQALTRDVDSQKLTVDEIVAIMPWKRDDADPAQNGGVEGGDIALNDVDDLLGTLEDGDEEEEEARERSSTEASSAEEEKSASARDKTLQRERARAGRESDVWRSVMHTVDKKRRDVETKDKKIKKKILHERVWERVRLFAR